MLGPHSTPLGYAVCCSVLWRSCSSVSVRLAPFTCSRRSQIEWMLGVGPGSGHGLVSPPALSCAHHQGELSSIAMNSSPLEEMSKGHGQFSCFHILSVGSPTPTPPCQLYYVIQVRCKVYFPRVLQLGRGAPSSTTGGRDKGERHHPYHYIEYEQLEPAIPQTQGNLPHASANMVSTAVLPR